MIKTTYLNIDGSLLEQSLENIESSLHIFVEIMSNRQALAPWNQRGWSKLEPKMGVGESFRELKRKDGDKFWAVLFTYKMFWCQVIMREGWSWVRRIKISDVRRSISEMLFFCGILCYYATSRYLLSSSKNRQNSKKIAESLGFFGFIFLTDPPGTQIEKPWSAAVLGVCLPLPFILEL